MRVFFLPFPTFRNGGPIRRRMTDTDGFRETPHPSSVTDGIGSSNTPSEKTRMGFENPSVTDGFVPDSVTVIHVTDRPLTDTQKRIGPLCIPSSHSQGLPVQSGLGKHVF
jgi:hypothetical protein